MKKLLLITLILSFVSCQKNIYKDENGIIKCTEDTQVGYIGEVDGVSYKVVDNKMLKRMVKNGDDITHICTSKVTDMSNLFYKSKLKRDISKWDVSNVTNMEGLFNESQFSGNISKWDVSNVTNMNRMFRYSKFKGDISNWNVSNVTDMSYSYWEEYLKKGINIPISKNLRRY